MYFSEPFQLNFQHSQQQNQGYFPKIEATLAKNGAKNDSTLSLKSKFPAKNKNGISKNYEGEKVSTILHEKSLQSTRDELAQLNQELRKNAID